MRGIVTWAQVVLFAVLACVVGVGLIVVAAIVVSNTPSWVFGLGVGFFTGSLFTAIGIGWHLHVKNLG